MELIEKIGTGVVIAAVAAILMYAFKLRQLYLLVPKMFAHTALTEKGKILELRAFNRGRSMEEDVQIDMPPGFAYDLVASDHPGVLLAGNQISISRITPRSEVSIILLAEGAIDAEKLSPALSSKTTKGKVVRTPEEVPQNAGTIVLVIGVLLLSTILVYILPSKLSEYQRGKKEAEQKANLARYSFLEEAGWRGIDEYVKSEAHRSYSALEFPIVFISARREGNYIETKMSAINKTAAPLSVAAHMETEDKKTRLMHREVVFDLIVNPTQRVPVVVGANIPDNYSLEEVYVIVSLKFGEEPRWGVRFYPSGNPGAIRVLQGMHKPKRS